MATTGFARRLLAGLQRVGQRVHAGVSWLLLTLSWLLMILPVGLLLRLLGRSRIDRGGRGPCGSNLRQRRQPLSAADLDRPF